MSTTSSPLFAATTNGAYALAGVEGVDIHVFATETARADWLAKRPEAGAVSVSEAKGLAPKVRYWDYHEGTLTSPEVAWTHEARASFGGSFGLTTCEGVAPALAFGW